MDVRRVYERLTTAFNSKDEEGVRRAIADDIEFVQPGSRLIGKDAYLDIGRMYWNAFPDFTTTVTAVHVAGDTVVEEGIFSATHKGNLASPTGDIPPTNRRVEIPYTDCFTIRGDVVSSDRITFDRLLMLEQLGLVPTPAAAG